MSGVLFIDDHVELLDSMRDSLELEGLTISTASTWDEGLTKFQVLAPDLVVADYNMPGSRQGLQLLAEFRAMRPAVRLILFSGYINKLDSEEIEELGVADRALDKTRASVDAVKEEMRSTLTNPPGPPSWQEVGAAYMKASKISPDLLEQLDKKLHRKIGR